MSRFGIIAAVAAVVGAQNLYAANSTPISDVPVEEVSFGELSAISVEEPVETKTSRKKDRRSAVGEDVEQVYTDAVAVLPQQNSFESTSNVIDDEADVLASGGVAQILKSVTGESAKASASSSTGLTVEPSSSAIQEIPTYMASVLPAKTAVSSVLGASAEVSANSNSTEVKVEPSSSAIQEIPVYMASVLPANTAVSSVLPASTAVSSVLGESTEVSANSNSTEVKVEPSSSEIQEIPVYMASVLPANTTVSSVSGESTEASVNSSSTEVKVEPSPAAIQENPVLFLESSKVSSSMPSKVNESGDKVSSGGSVKTAGGSFVFFLVLAMMW